MTNGIGEAASVFEVANIFRGRKRGSPDIDPAAGTAELRVVSGARE